MWKRLVGYGAFEWKGRRVALVDVDGLLRGGLEALSAHRAAGLVAVTGTAKVSRKE